MAWNKLSAALQQACVSATAFEDCGARGLDNLHIALYSTLTALGFRAEVAKPRNAPPLRCPLGQHCEKAKIAVKASRRATRTGSVGSHQLSADQAILTTLQQASEEERRASQIRLHHKLSTTNPKKLAEKIWGSALSSDPPECSQQECREFFSEVFKMAEPSSGSPSWLPTQHPPLSLQPLLITAEMVRRAIQKKSGSRSAPGLDGITYDILQHLPWIPALLATLFNKLVAQSTCPEIWRYGVTVLLHKGGKRELGNYRPITLTPTLGKLFHSIVASWLEPALTSSGIIPTEIQKGFIRGVAGAVEHDLVLDAILAEAKQSKKKLFMVLVDLKNAFGSVPHSRIGWALKTFGVPPWVQQYISNLYSRMFTQMSCKSWSTDFLQVQRGVLQGDTLSPLLFLLVMQVGLHALSTSCPNQGFRSADNNLHFMKCFADDLTIITQDAGQLQSALTKFEGITAWLGLEMKPAKCRAFGISKGRYRRIDICINGETILNVEDAPTKFLGMQLSLSQSFKEKAALASASVHQIMEALHSFLLPKQDKVLLYKNFAIPKIRWVLMVQELLPTALARLNQQAEKYIKQWWVLPRAASRDALRLTMGIPSLSDLAGQGQLVKYSLAQASKDPTVNAVWKQRAATRHRPVRKLLRQFGATIPNQRSVAMSSLKTTQLEDLRTTVQQLLVQGAWAKLGTTLDSDKRWRCMVWGLPASVAQFASKAALDVLPTRANLCRWRVACDSMCPRCGEVKETLHHTLNNCSHQLHTGRYKWRHDSVLSHLFQHLSTTHHANQCITVDLPGHTYQLPFTSDAAWRPDIVIFEGSSSKITFIELTVPYEANAASAHHRKATKYAALLQNARDAGMVPTLYCVEMGSRGLPCAGWDAWAAKHHLPSRITKECAEIALRASHSIWLLRDTEWPQPPLLSLK